MKVIPIFDLDDTLYPEISYVYCGFEAVAKYLEQEFGWKSSDSLNEMKKSVIAVGRGDIFDNLLRSKGKYSKTNVKKCVRVYRNHNPDISLNDEVKELLTKLRGPRFLVTDGNKIVQAKKVLALGLQSYFTKVYITHRYGLHNCKPSIYCFNLIRILLNCDWNDMVYIGDNPVKDFVNLKPLGMKTIRVLTGPYSKVSVAPEFDADLYVDNLNQLLTLSSLDFV